MGDAWRLALGTLTAVPTSPPGPVGTGVAARAVLLAPLAALPLGTLVAVLLWGGRTVGLAPLAVAAVALGALAAGSRALHLDGLADTADGLTASYDAHRSLAVMKSGNTGPAGTAVVVVVLLAQAAALAELLAVPWGPLVAGVLVCVSRVAHALACRRGVPAANPGGLGLRVRQQSPAQRGHRGARSWRVTPHHGWHQRCSQNRCRYGPNRPPWGHESPTTSEPNRLYGGNIMRNIWTKSLAVTAVSGVLVVGGAGMASADTGGDTDNRSNETNTQVDDNRIEDSGNISLDDILNDGVDVGDVASGNDVLNGNDTVVSDVLNGNLSGNDADVDANPDVDADAEASADSNEDGGEDNEEGLLGGLL